MKYTICKPGAPDRYLTCRPADLESQLAQGETAHEGFVKLVDDQPQALSPQEQKQAGLNRPRPIRAPQLARALKAVKRAIETGNTDRLQALIDRLE